MSQQIKVLILSIVILGTIPIIAHNQKPQKIAANFYHTGLQIIRGSLEGSLLGYDSKCVLLEEDTNNRLLHCYTNNINQDQLIHWLFEIDVTNSHKTGIVQLKWVSWLICGFNNAKCYLIFASKTNDYWISLKQTYNHYQFIIDDTNSSNFFFENKLYGFIHFCGLTIQNNDFDPITQWNSEFGLIINQFVYIPER